LTQIYQHEEDQRRGDRTLSIVLGKKGTFALSAILFSVAFSMLLKLFSENEQMNLFYLFMLCTSPVIVYFSYWLFRVWKNDAEANYNNTMQMTIISSSCMLLYFILINLL